MLRIKKEVDLKELEKFGFVDRIFTREINGRIIYKVVITSDHNYLQIRIWNTGDIASSLQTLIFDLINAGLVEKVSEGDNE